MRMLFNSKLLFCIGLLSEIVLQIFMVGLIKKGDHIDYRNFYDAMTSVSSSEFLDFNAIDFIGSNDILYNVIVYLYSRVVDFDVFVFSTNVLYFYLIATLLQRAGLGIINVFLPLSFYIIGIQFSAQRLMLAISMLIMVNYYRRKLLFVLPAMVHTQVIPLLFYMRKWRGSFLMYAGAIAFIISSYYLDFNFISKLFVYIYERSVLEFSDFAPLIYFFTVVILSYDLREDKNPIFLFVIFAILIFAIGSGRVNIMIFVYTLLLVGAGQVRNVYGRLLLIPFFVYDVIKGLSFISNVAEGGSGFDAFQ